jgi:hypothetical protein
MEGYCGNTGFCLPFSQQEAYCYEVCVRQDQGPVGTNSGAASCAFYADGGTRSGYVCWGFGSLFGTDDPQYTKFGLCAGDCRTIENDPVAKTSRGGSACRAGYTCEQSGTNAGFCCTVASDGGTECEAYL